MVRGALALLLLLVASTAQGASLSISTDRSVYALGDIITLTVRGSSNGTTEVSTQVYAKLRHDGPPLSLEFVGASQTQGETFSGAIPWTLGALDAGPNFAVAINQIIGLAPLAASRDVIGTIQYRITNFGIWNFYIEAETADYFGAAVPSSISLTLIPEPGSVSLLALGLIALATRRKTVWLPCPPRQSSSGSGSPEK